MNSIYIIDFCILAAAIYLLVVGIGMKKSGKIHKSVMGEELIKNCVDERAFIDAIYPWMIVFSIASLIAGIAGFLLDYFKVISWANYPTLGLFLIVFFLFIFQYRRALKKYFKDM
ncbi:MAG: hypothetical protein II067_01530 [Agathobacter sp.]|uniref:hypothetical protein n=1 Tax=Agathobacter sp. TaxID=2021311 RepID=UPI0004E1EB24|nr:hypothetical protein [Agathobacter sp.]MBQ1680874.1 hypothetical protein [Agathobacter sp.]MCR5677106.1 hypothetical protein [Agathobacter sp.]